MTSPKILFVLTSNGQIEGTDVKTGFFMPELAHAYNVLAPHVDIVIASPAGGEAPFIEESKAMFKEDQDTMKFIAEKSETWKNTVKLETLLHRLNDFSAVYFPGGHGPMFDLVNDSQSQQVAREMYEAGGIVSAVCHGPAALLNVKLSDGSYLLKGSRVTGFSNVEEEQMGLKEHMPYLLEDELKQRSGGLYETTEAWGSKVVNSADGRIITGQNPGSTAALAARVLEVLGRK
ncbi:MAG: hypothetical protein Q9220_000802 [cf. Caloplaca sp. 1 TL-2023]